MKPRQIIKIVTDVLMTIAILLLMAYSLVGETAHEWIGIGMFALFIFHHVLNVKWSKSIFKGKYTPYRVLQTALAILALTAMLGSMVSGIIISRHALKFLNITSGQSWARTVHLLSAYWGFIIISLHLGLHWNIMLNMTERMFKKPSKVRKWVMRMIGAAIAGYGVYAFIKREIGSYMILKNQFVFFDFGEPLILFLLDYIAVMGLFVFVGHYLAKVLMEIGKNEARSSQNQEKE